MTTGIQVLASQQATSVADGTAPVTFDTTRVRCLALDITTVAFTGGTAPTVTYYVDRLGADGTWYQVYASSAIAAPGALSIDMGDFSLVVAGVQHAVFTGQARLRTLYGGTAAPTDVTYSYSIIGRS